MRSSQTVLFREGNFENRYSILVKQISRYMNGISKKSSLHKTYVGMLFIISLKRVTKAGVRN